MNTCLNKKELSWQPFPKFGVLSKNKDLSLGRLNHRLASQSQFESGAKAYAYILSSVSFDADKSSFVQEGSAPNFQGNHITLCTCKHYMRSSRSVKDWEKVWIAGFTSHGAGKNYLFYLMQVEKAFESFRKLWDADILSQKTKRVKNASHKPLGDLYRPLNTAKDFSIRSYEEPMWGHSHRNTKNQTGWHNDICYRSRAGKHAPLLVGNPQFSFLWTKPLICFSRKPFRNHRCYEDLQKLFEVLQKAPIP